MPVLDLNFSAARGSALPAECDVCIVGSGPAGSTMARELSDTGLRVVVLESGGFERLDASDELDRIDNVGRPRAEQWSVRNRIVGGSSHTWGGRCAPFDEIDFERRSWVPDSGWPFGLGELKSYLDRSAPYLGLAYGSDYNDDRFWRLAERPAPDLQPDPQKLLPFFWQFSRDDEESYPFEYTRFGRHLAKRLGANVTLLAGATVLRVKTDAAGEAVTGIEFASPDGQRHFLKAATVALCAGGLENARVLLLSDDVSPTGLGNRHDLVGRYLMDHLRGPVAEFDVARTRALRKRFGRYNLQDRFFRAGLRLSPQAQAREGLLNCAVWLGETLAPDDPGDAIRNIVKGRPTLADVTAVAANAGLILRSVKDYFIDRNGVERKLSALSLECMVEQRPDPDSRVTLSDRRDRFGSRMARVDWRSHPDEARTMHRMADFVVEEFARLGFPVPERTKWVLDKAPVPLEFVDVAHPTSTTRMSEDPAHGVVDPQGQVHGMRGLFVAGSSVFPTAGHCNPTQMIVALAIRTADAVKAERQTAPVRLAAASAEPSSSDGAAPRVGRLALVTGATGRIGRVLVEDLLERGYRVRATTSKVPPADPTGAVEWRQFDFVTGEDYDGLVAGCDAVLHLAAEIGRMDRMQAINVEATRRLAMAAERARTSAFCYVSTVSVYGSGRGRIAAEDGDVLTHDRDVPSEYWALDYVRSYGRTKLAGELAIRREAAKVPYVILRPTVVVDVDGLIDIREWGTFKRYLAAHRHAHHVYVRDVTDAIIWFAERAMAGGQAPGSVELFNLAEDDIAEPTHAAFMRKAYEASGDRRYRTIAVPWVADWLHDFLRFRTLPLRSPLWRMRFPNDRLRAAGYRHRFGMAEAQSRALRQLQDKAR